MSLWSAFRAFFTAGKGVLAGLAEESTGSDPLELFHRWFQEAVKAGVYLAESVALATVSAAGRPAVRFMLLKKYDERGFVFFTNYESRKAMELEANPEAALVLHWGILQRQVRLEGTVERISAEESEIYFRSRPRGSQIGAWASQQSFPVFSRKEMDERWREYVEKFRDRQVPLPPFWGGYRLKPRSMEFWQGRLNRLHDRLRFTLREDGTWERQRLQP